jgi:NAD(P)H-nitrite reductase large subunit
MENHYLIIGNSAGGIGAAEAIREVDAAGRLTIVSEEPYQAYSRPLISEYVAGHRTMERMLFRMPGFYEQNNINLVLDNKVTEIDTGNKTAHFADGRRIGWSKLLLATGGRPIIPDIAGLDREGIYPFLTFDDARKVSAMLPRVKHAVIIGGGLIGISIAHALVERNIAVTIVEMKDRLLNTILDQTAASIVEQKLRHEGVETLTDNTVTELLGSPSVSRAVLNNGDMVPCDMAILAIGVRPRVELADDAGIKTSRGILVDVHMTSSHPDVYSCGDAAEAYDFITGDNRVIPIWPGAYIGGRTAGFNMSGVSAEYPGSTIMNSLNYFGLDITTAGQFEPVDDATAETISDCSDGAYRKIILTGNRITGMVFINQIEKAGIIYGLMKDKVDVTDFKEELLSEQFGLLHLPHDLRQERIGKPEVSGKPAFIPVKQRGR